MAITVAITVITMITVEAALTSGVTEKRIIEKILTGRVMLSGTAVKKVMTLERLYYGLERLL